MNFHPIENSSATAEIVVPILIDWYGPKSVLDLGCNVGWWLHWFWMNGIQDFIGIDGDNFFSVTAPKSIVMAYDLTKSLDLIRKFDLVLCLEVAEHLSEPDVIVETCIRHSDLIFWSAATPGQGGFNHVNEQPNEYWIEKFAKHGYSARKLADLLPELPHDYYRKNAIEFKKI
jgi:2-polyprenyl-3-methyl-5-hydroxy-6-metoxy-1,4-benzoquinol methylase